MNARVADFGISKLFGQGEAVVQTKTLSTIWFDVTCDNNDQSTDWKEECRQKEMYTAMA